MSGATLLIGIYIPDVDDPADVDPQQVADELVAIINEERRRNAGSSGDVEVSLFPAERWLPVDRHVYVIEGRTVPSWMEKVSEVHERAATPDEVDDGCELGVAYDDLYRLRPLTDEAHA